MYFLILISDYYLYKNNCLDVCPVNFFKNNLNNTCEPGLNISLIQDDKIADEFIIKFNGIIYIQLLKFI